MKTLIRVIPVCVGLMAAGILFNGASEQEILIKQAEARAGRPLTPGSVAGVARRTTRRIIRRSTIYVPALPPNCQVVVIEGATLHHCGGTYYQPDGNQYVVVYVD